MLEPAPDRAWTGVLLVGGHSRRMGCDKLRLRLPDGALLADLPAQALTATCGRRFAVRRPDGPAYAADGFEQLVDVAPGGGPLAGVVPAILACDTPWMLIVGGDMPALSPAFLRSFMSHATTDPHRALMICARRLEPMPLALPATLGAEVIQRFRSGERALRRAIPAALLRLATPAALHGAADESPWLSVNTPADWQLLVRGEFVTSA